MKQILFILTLMIPSLFAGAQYRKAEIYPSEFSTPTRSWWVSPNTLLEFDASTGTITHNNIGGRSDSNPTVWIRDIHHIKFRIDTTSSPQLADGLSQGWKIIGGSVGEYLNILAPDDFRNDSSLPIAIYDASGTLQGGTQEWRGDPVRVSWLQPGIYFVRIGNLVSLSFLKK